MKLAYALLLFFSAALTSCASAVDEPRALKGERGLDGSTRESNDVFIREHLWDSGPLTQFMRVNDEKSATSEDIPIVDWASGAAALTQASLQLDCLTVDQCRRKHDALKSAGDITGYFYVDDWADKGCFQKGENVFFGTGGTVEEMTETDLPGVRERLYCEPEAIVAETKAPTDKPTKQPTPLPSPAPTPLPTLPPSPAPTTKSPTLPPSPAPTTKSPTKAPSPEPSPAPTTGNPTPSPSSEPTTKSPTMEPSIEPTPSPTTQSPTEKPSASPVTGTPTSKPSLSPETGTPTSKPSLSPVTDAPTAKPSLAPVTGSPTLSPVTAEPTPKPTDGPSASPSEKPTTGQPTPSPSPNPTLEPSASPTTKAPSLGPSPVPTESPTVSPTESMPVSLGGIVWNDENENGILDEAEEKVSGVVVQAKTCDNDRTVAFGFSRSDGSYRLNDIGPAGCYYLTFLPSDGYVVTTPEGGRTEDIILGRGEVDLSRNAGVVATPPTAKPTASPAVVDGSASIVATPTTRPSMAPTTKAPTLAPSEDPMAGPVTESPTVSPTSSPSAGPTNRPSASPTTADPTTADPSLQPSEAPVTPSPTEEPSEEPTTEMPTPAPSLSPVVERGDGLIQQTPTTADPTKRPSVAPVTSTPTNEPTTATPSKGPTSLPTVSPSKRPSVSPSRSPSKAPARSAKPTVDEEEDLGFLVDGGSMSMSMPSDEEAVPTKKPSTSSPSLGSAQGASSSPVDVVLPTPTVSELQKMKFTLFETEGQLSDSAVADLTSAAHTFYNAQLASYYNAEGNYFHAIELVPEAQTSVTMGLERRGRRLRSGRGGLRRRRRNSERRLDQDEDLVLSTDDDSVMTTDDSVDFDTDAIGVVASPMQVPGDDGLVFSDDGDDGGITFDGDDSVDFDAEASPIQRVSGTRVVYGGTVEFLGDAPPSSDVVEAITLVSKENSEELVSAIVGTGNAELSNVYLVLVEKNDDAVVVPTESPTSQSESFLQGPNRAVASEQGTTSGTRPSIIVAVAVGVATLTMLAIVFATRSRRRGVVEGSFDKAIGNDLDASIDDNIQSTSGEEFEVVEAGQWQSKSRGGGLLSVADMNCQGTKTIEKEDSSVIPKSWLSANAVAVKSNTDEEDKSNFLPKPFRKALEDGQEDTSIIMVDVASSFGDTSTEIFSRDGRGAFPTRHPDGAFPTNAEGSHIGTVKDDDLSSTKPSAHEVASAYSQETGESKSSLNQFISDLVWLENKIADEGAKDAVEINIKEDSTITQSEQGRDLVIKDSYSYECDSFVASLSPRSMSDEESTVRTTSSSLAANSQAMSIVCRDCYIPAGNLDIEIASTKDGPVVKSINDPSLAGHVNEGDLIMALDDRDTRSLSAEQLATLLSSRANFQRKLTLLHFGGARA